MAISWLLDKMSGYAVHEAMVYDNHSISYGKLLDYYHDWTRIVADCHISPGQVVALVGDYSPSVCGAILALTANRNIIVPLSVNVRHKLQDLLDIAQVHTTFHFEADRFHKATYTRGQQKDLLSNLSSAGQAGLILYTSGTTGVPKAIVHNFSKFIERFKTPRDTLRTLSFLLFDHIGGINTFLHTLANGGTIICPASRSPDSICAAIEKHKVELLPASPSFLTLLIITGAYKHYDLSSLKIISYGTEVMPEYTLQQLRVCLPGVQFRQTYGLSEIGILRAKSKDSNSIWFKVGGEGIEVRIKDGVLHIRSETAMEGYLNAPNPFDPDGWFDTQDQVVTDGEYIRILGRKSEIINVGGRKVFPAEVEEVLMLMPEIKDVIVKGETNPLLGNIVTAIVNIRDQWEPNELRKKIREFCMGKLEDFQIPVKVNIQTNELFSERYKKIRN